MKILKNTLLFTMAFIAIETSAQPYRNPNLSAEERAKDLLGRLTLSEKASLMEHTSPAIERLGIPQWNWWNEALHGVGRNGTATVLPITMAMASSFDDALVQQAFTAVSDEARAKNNLARKQNRCNIYEGLSFWTPNINIFRDPRWGRGQETYGEDPYLTSRMGLAVVRGLQGPEGGKYMKLYACAKHFAVHSGPEWNRHKFDVEQLPARDLWETYLPAFKTLVQQGHVREVMCAYQRYDGEPCCGNTRFLQQILRKEWGFQGLVTSDCWAVNDFWMKGYHEWVGTETEAISKALYAGTDVECGNTYHDLTEAVAQGLTTEEKINESLLRLLKARFELGDFDCDSLVPWRKLGPEVIASPEHHALALKLAREGQVLLLNKINAETGSPTLPLTRDARIVVMGPNAADSTMMWGNYNGFPAHTTTILQGIKQKCSHVTYTRGCEWVEDSIHEIPAECKEADVVIFVGGISPRLEGEEMKTDLPGFQGGDRTNIELPQVQRNLLATLHQAGKHIIYVNCSGSAIALEPETANCDAILQAWYGGEAGGEAVADVLFGDVNPSGKLPVTFYRNTEQLPDFLDYRMEGRTYRYMHEAPLFDFGYGLSYSNFTFGKPKYKNGKVTVTLKNCSTRDGEEVVQVYLRKKADLKGPNKALRGFKRVLVRAGESTRVEVDMPRENFEWWDEESQAMNLRGGTFDLMVGSSSRDADLQTIEVKIK